jgi:hypothetical protein
MAYTKTPTTWLGAGYSANSGSNTVTFTTGTASTNVTVAELTNTEANASTGDIRKIMLAFVEQFYRAYNATATADRPLKMTITRNIVAGQDNVNTANYQFSFTLSPTVLEVADEV